MLNWNVRKLIVYWLICRLCSLKEFTYHKSKKDIFLTFNIYKLFLLDPLAATDLPKH